MNPRAREITERWCALSRFRVLSYEVAGSWNRPSLGRLCISSSRLHGSDWYKKTTVLVRMLSTTSGSPFSNTRRPTIQRPRRIPYNPANWHPAALNPSRVQAIPHYSASNERCAQEQGWIEEFQSRTNSASQPRRHPSQTYRYPPPPRINPHHTYHPASMSQSRRADDDAGNIGNVTGAEEVAVGGTGNKMGKREGQGKGTQKDDDLEKGGFGAVTGAEEVKAKL